MLHLRTHTPHSASLKSLLGCHFPLNPIFNPPIYNCSTCPSPCMFINLIGPTTRHASGWANGVGPSRRHASEWASGVFAGGISCRRRPIGGSASGVRYKEIQETAAAFASCLHFLLVIVSTLSLLLLPLTSGISFLGFVMEMEVGGSLGTLCLQRMRTAEASVRAG